MVGPVSGSKPTPVYNAENIFLERTGWNAKVGESFLAKLNEAADAGDITKVDALMDIYQQAAIAAAPLMNVPQTGQTSGGTSQQGSGFRPAEAAQRLDSAALKKGNAPSPAESPVDEMTVEESEELVGKNAIPPAADLPPPVKPSGKAVSSSDNAQYQKLQPVDGSVLDENATAEDGEAVSLQNSPAAIAARQRKEYEGKGVQVEGGWDKWQTDRAAKIKKEWSDAGGVWQLNPKKQVKEAMDQVQGVKFSPEYAQALEADLSNRFVQQNGGLLVTGGQLGLATQNQYFGQQNMMMGMNSTGIAQRLVGSVAGAGIGAAMGMPFGGPIGAMVGGYLGSKLGNLAGGLLSGTAMMNPSMMGMPGLAMNPVAMGMGGGLATVGMMGGFMGGGGFGLNGMVSNQNRMLQGAETLQSFTQTFQYAAMNQETRIKRIMTKQALAAGDQQMVRMLTSSNMPIEKLIAMWSLKNCSRYEQELRDKMLAAEDARQREKLEANKEKANAGMSSMASGVGGTVGGIAGTLIGGPIGGMVGSLVGGTAGKALTDGSLSPSAMGDGTNPPESAAALQLEVQMALEEWKRSYELASNMLKTLHDMAMTAINNTRG